MATDQIAKLDNRDADAAARRARRTPRNTILLQTRISLESRKKFDALWTPHRRTAKAIVEEAIDVLYAQLIAPPGSTPQSPASSTPSQK